jgi:hypothetical protein
MSQRTLAEVTEDGLQVLFRELGIADTLRFLYQFTIDFGNYTKERAAHDNEVLDEVLAAIKARRATTGLSM